MTPHKNLSTVINQLFSATEYEIVDLEEGTINDYKSLNHRCDKVINKIKNRKKKKNTQTIEE